jgi:hypothetical protein
MLESLTSYKIHGLSSALPENKFNKQRKLQVALFWHTSCNNYNYTSKFDSTRYNELWLLIASQLPQLGGLASTFMVSALVDLNALNNCFHEMLLKSRFGAVYLHLLMEHNIFEWSPSKKWCRASIHR